MKRSDISTLTVLSAALEAHRGGVRKATWEYILEKTNTPMKIIYAAMDREDRAGYLEWGVSLRTAWLSEKGKDKLLELFNNNVDELFDKIDKKGHRQ